MRVSTTSGNLWVTIIRGLRFVIGLLRPADLDAFLTLGVQGSGMAALVCAKAVLDWLWCLGHDRADCTAFAGAGCGSHRVDAFDWQGFAKSGCFWGRTERRMTGNKGGSL